MSTSLHCPSTRNSEAQLEACTNKHASGRHEAHIKQRIPSNRAHSVPKSVHVLGSACRLDARNPEACPQGLCMRKKPQAPQKHCTCTPARGAACTCTRLQGDIQHASLHACSAMCFLFRFVPHVALHVRTSRQQISFQTYKLLLKTEKKQRETRKRNLSQQKEKKKSTIRRIPLSEQKKKKRKVELQEKQT